MTTAVLSGLVRGMPYPHRSCAAPAPPRTSFPLMLTPFNLQLNKFLSKKIEVCGRKRMREQTIGVSIPMLVQRSTFEQKAGRL